MSSRRWAGAAPAAVVGALDSEWSTHPDMDEVVKQLDRSILLSDKSKSVTVLSDAEAAFDCTRG